MCRAVTFHRILIRRQQHRRRNLHRITAVIILAVTYRHHNQRLHQQLQLLILTQVHNNIRLRILLLVLLKVILDLLAVVRVLHHRYQVVTIHRSQVVFPTIIHQVINKAKNRVELNILQVSRNLNLKPILILTPRIRTITLQQQLCPVQLQAKHITTSLILHYLQQLYQPRLDHPLQHTLQRHLWVSLPKVVLGYRRQRMEALARLQQSQLQMISNNLGIVHL